MKGEAEHELFDLLKVLDSSVPANDGAYAEVKRVLDECLTELNLPADLRPSLTQQE